MPDLVERTAALDALEAVLQTAADGRGSVVLVTGEAGIGKTALVTHFADRHRTDVRVLMGLCDDLATPRPLGPFRDLADQLSGACAELLRREPATGAASVHRMLLDDLRRGRTPTVLVLEDVHWADQATIDAITVLGRRLADLPVLLVLTLRLGEVDPGHPLWSAIDALQRASTVTVDLAPLSRQAVAALAGEDADRIYALSNGNPFFVAELLASGGGPPPPSLANAVLSRVARLPDRPRQLLELVSMVPSRMPTRLLDVLDPDWAPAAEPAERRQLLTSDPQHVRFRHELTRAAVRSSVPPGRRRQLHRMLLRALQDIGAEPAELVHHAEAAGVPDVVADYALPAARQARALDSHREALAHFRRAAGCSGRFAPPERARLWEELAETAHLVGRSDEAVGAADAAIDLAEAVGDEEAVARCRQLRSQLHWFAGDGASAWHDACSALRALIRSGSSAEVARGYVGCAELAMLASRAEDALRWGTRALELAADDDVVLGRALAAVGATRMQLDPSDTGLLHAALHAARRTGSHQHAVLSYTALAFCNLLWVRPEQSLRSLEEGVGYAREHEVDTMVGYLEAVRAWLLLRRGEGDDASIVARAALARTAAPESTVAGLVARTVLAERAVRRGDDDADARLAAAAADADRTGELKRIAPVLELQVERALTCGAPLPVARLEDITRRVGLQPLRCGAAGARVAAWATVCGVPHDFQGPAPEPYAAMMERDWRAAADAFGAVGWQHDRALLLSLSHAEESLAEAVEIARALEARPLEERSCRRMRDAGLTVPRGALPSTRANPAHLTDRQLEVLALVREGRGNADIAAVLHLSPRTVEHHVAGIFTKLGVANRAEAVARSADLHLV
ncbi:ATP-binding protein [Blastococcus saxobsidens]|uniref:Putative Transcriptional regulator, luxR family n=1 Tax=Blastococcus saxobsidens (strain DD2) TaxID=1146883 RepID=H6RRA6_BLASD|nr:LuxR family transcriptional regulator [Blastococcus saxobsidens]CCG04186.1 Putative Transcriptional regulator, luxR family [Blastococcus saxobsidens DD2]